MKNNSKRLCSIMWISMWSYVLREQQYSGRECGFFLFRLRGLKKVCDYWQPENLTSLGSVSAVAWALRVHRFLLPLTAGWFLAQEDLVWNPRHETWNNWHFASKPNKPWGSKLHRKNCAIFNLIPVYSNVLYKSWFKERWLDLLFLFCYHLKKKKRWRWISQ